MSADKSKEVFYKDALCKALTGHTPMELRDACSEEVAELDLLAADAPRTLGEVFVDHRILFMTLSFNVRFLPLPKQQMFELFQKFKAWESYVHPRDTTPPHPYAAYFEPTYDLIERAYSAGDDRRFVEGLTGLIDQIIHD